MSRSNGPWILGISASHNGGACLLQGDKVVVAIQEERLSRVKRQRTFLSKPMLSVGYCLDYAGISLKELTQIVTTVQGNSSADEQNIANNPQFNSIIHKIPIKHVSHHLAHAASAVGPSGYSECGVLVVDGQGSPIEDLQLNERRSIIGRSQPDCWEAVSIYKASARRINSLAKWMVPKGQWLIKGKPGMPYYRSIGGMYSAVAQQIFGDPMEAGKVMGLAAFGEPNFAIDDFIAIRGKHFLFKDYVPSQFNKDAIWPNHKKKYANLAASVQRATEYALLKLVDYAHRITKSSNLCLAGGVALNAIANERIIQESKFENTFIVPAAEDSGTALGAAFIGLWEHWSKRTSISIQGDLLGKRYSQSEIGKAIKSFPFLENIRSKDYIDICIEKLLSGQIGGWFQNGSEFGPRALGNRSIISDPRQFSAKERINAIIKEREEYRPFAPAILRDKLDEWFQNGRRSLDSPYMLRILKYKSEVTHLVPAVVHQQTGRAQTVSEANGPFYTLIDRFYQKTSVPILLNTSFNLKDEPIVESPHDAITSLVLSELDFCVIHDNIISKSKGLKSVLDLSLHLRRRVNFSAAEGKSNNGFTLKVPGQWGQIKVWVPTYMETLVALIDGKKTCREILDSMGIYDEPTRIKVMDDIVFLLRHKIILVA